MPLNNHNTLVQSQFQQLCAAPAISAINFPPKIELKGEIDEDCANENDAAYESRDDADHDDVNEETLQESVARKGRKSRR